MRTNATAIPLRSPLMNALLTSVALLASPVISHAQSAEPKVQTAAPRATVTIARAALAPMVGQVIISGSVVARDEVLVFPAVSGSIIETLAVDVGQSVVAGQVLATLNNSTLTAQVAQARAEMARAEASVSQASSQIVSARANAKQALTSLERAGALRRNGTVTQAALDQAVATEQTASAAVASALDGLSVARAQKQLAQASLDIAQLNLDRATLRAPVDGLISARNGQLGAIASSGGEPIFRLIKDGIVEVEAEVIETALGSIKPGHPAELNVAGNGIVNGSVRLISPTVDPRNRLGTIRIAILDQHELRSGLFASGAITTAERVTLSVPTTAVLSDKDGTFVFVVKSDKLEKRAVKTGLIWKGLREITQGLEKGEAVVARAGAFFADGDEINAIEPRAAGASK